MFSIAISINAFACLNSFILFGLLGFRKKNSVANYALAGVMLIPALYFSNSILMLLGQGNDYFFYFFIVQTSAAFFAPLVAIYVYSILGKPINKLKFLFLGSITIGLIPIWMFFDFLNFTQQEKNTFFDSLINGPYPLSATIYSIIFYSFQEFVFVLIFLKLRKIKLKFLNTISNMEMHIVTYLKNFMLILVLLNLSIVVLYLSFQILFVEYYLLPIIITTIYSFIIFYAFKNNLLFKQKDYSLQIIDLEKSLVIKKSRIENPEPLARKIIDVLSKNEIITESDLTIYKLANEIDTSVAETSQCINQHLHQNFQDLINSYRVEYAKNLLLENHDLTIEGVAYTAGFNSRATFYRAFKKHTGITPTQYLSRIGKSETLKN